MGGQGVGHDGLRLPLLPLHQAAVDPGILGNVVVLTMKAHEIAAHRGDGVRAGAGEEVEERLLLDGVDVFGDDPAVIEAEEAAVLVFPDVAEASFPRVDLAEMGAQMALNLAVLQAFPHSRRNHRPSSGVASPLNYNLRPGM